MKRATKQISIGALVGFLFGLIPWLSGILCHPFGVKDELCSQILTFPAVPLILVDKVFYPQSLSYFLLFLAPVFYLVLGGIIGYLKAYYNLQREGRKK